MAAAGAGGPPPLDSRGPYTNTNPGSKDSSRRSVALSDCSLAIDPGRVSAIWRSSRTRNFTGGQTALADFMEKTMGQGEALTKLIVPDPVKSEMRVGHLELIIQSCPKLTYVDLSGCQKIQDFSCLAYLEDTLNYLDLSSCSLSSGQLRVVTSSLTSLTHLILRDNHLNPEIGLNIRLDCLVHLPLAHLDLSHTGIKGSDLEVLAPLGATLTHLILSNCRKLTARYMGDYKDLASFLKHFNHLIHLDLSCNLIKKKDLVILLTNLPSLSDLNLQGCNFRLGTDLKMEECKRHPDMEAIRQLRSLLQE